MNTPNPLQPQGTLQEQSKRKSQIRLIVFSILAIHVLLLGALLIQGCKPEQPQEPKIEPPPLPPVTETNPPPPLPPVTSNETLLPPPVNVSTTPPPYNLTPPPDAVPPVVTEHVIAKGESFGSLSKKYGVSVKAIQQANPGVDSSRLKIGQKITIPPKPPGGPDAPSASAGRGAEPEVAVGETLYTVQKGDNLTKIARERGTTAKAIRAANNLRTDQLRVGQKLKIPARTAPPAAAPSAAPATSTPAPIEPPTR